MSSIASVQFLMLFHYSLAVKKIIKINHIHTQCAIRGRPMHMNFNYEYSYFTHNIQDLIKIKTLSFHVSFI